jgi:hypothetical protein
MAVGSAGSFLLLAGCGGGGSAKNAPKPVTGGTTACSLAQATNVPSVSDLDPYGPAIYFSKGTSNCNFPYDSTAMRGTAAVAPFMGCTNPLISGSQATIQDMYLSIVEKLIVSGDGTTTPYQAVVRTLRLHLAIPHDASGATQLDKGFVFSVGDPTNPTNCSEVFSGEIMVNDPSAADGSNNWTFQITGGTIEILNDYNPIGLIGLQLKNLVATAAAAGTGSGSNNSALGTLNMQGTSQVYFDLTGANAT